MVIKNPSQYEKGKTTVYFVRHGDRIHIPNHKNIGLEQPGPGLSSLGRRQAKSVAKKFFRIKNQIDVFYCSSMQRAKETAEEIRKIIKKKPKIYPQLSEFNKFVWQRRIYHHHFWKHYKKHRSSIKILDKILNENKGKVIVIVAHGNVIKGLIGKKLGLSLKQIGKLDYHNCHISLVRFKGTKLDYLHYFNSKELV